MSQSPIFELNKQLGKGINMGNMFEAPTETEWGNPFKDDYFQRIASLGFNHVRIPIRWDTPARTLQTEPYTIDNAFLQRIKYVVDKALNEKLYVIINMHHHDAIFSTPDAVKSRFLSQWKQIAEFFKGYDNRLVFEVMNEPNTNLTPEKWNVFFADALAMIRSVSKTRAVLMGVANWGGLGNISALKIPKDDNLILTIHYYEPFNFTHQGAEWVSNSQGWLGTKWNNTTLERDAIANQFQYAKAFAKANNLPIHIGEFGAYSKADLDSRVKWSNFLARWFEENGFSWAYWEFSAGFGIYNPATNQYLQPLVDALTKNPMSQPVVVITKKIVESAFTETDNDWNLYVQGTAKATKNLSKGTATIAVSQPSTDWWHVQFVRNNLALKKGSTYLVTFEASASSDAGFTTYIGKASGAYNAYSGYKGFTATNGFQTFSYTFTMQDPDDAQARIVFDLASTQTTFSIKNFTLQEIISDGTSPILSAAVTSPEVSVFPNPAQTEVLIKGIERFSSYQLVDALGKVLATSPLHHEPTINVALPHSSTNLLLLILRNEQEVKVVKIKKVE